MARAALAIDHGMRRTGFAVVDALRIAVAPLPAFTGTGEALLRHVEGLLRERDVGHVVVGYPWNMDGTPGPRAAEVDAFIAALERRIPGLAVVRQDERLSTKEAESRLLDAGHHGRARRERKDSWSAVVLLEDWIRSA